MLKLHINEDFTTGRMAFHLVDLNETTDVRKTYSIGKKGELVETTYENLTPSEPIMVLPAKLAKALIEGCRDFADQRGIKTEREDWMKGAMTVMQKHLDREVAISDRLMGIVEKGAEK